LSWYASSNQSINNGTPGDDGAGGITHLLGFVDNVLACVPLALEDREFLCDHFKTLGKPLG
jgi:hypothetical protein